MPSTPRPDIDRGVIVITASHTASTAPQRFATAGVLVATLLLAALAVMGNASFVFRMSAVVALVLALGCLAALRVNNLNQAVGLPDQELVERLSKLETESLMDPVTGLGNVRSFQIELQREVGRAARHGHAVALALIEADAFAHTADLQGNLEGDKLLASLAMSLGGRRAEDRTFRLTGGEFGLILPYTTAREVYPLMESLRMEAERGGFGSTVTIGVADLQGPHVSESELRQRAETALSEAKRNGRNAVVAFASRTPNALIDAFAVTA